MGARLHPLGGLAARRGPGRRRRDRRRAPAPRASSSGVFVNPTLDEVARAADELHLTHVQLHGDEGPSFCAEVARRTGAKVIKAVRVGARRRLPGPRALPQRRLPPARHGGAAACAGGTGETWDWALAGRRRSTVPLILSGGLTAENVAAGIAAVDPYAVDVASGVEASPGIKDPDKLRAFMAAATRVGGTRRDDRRGAPVRPLRRPVRARDADAGAGRARGRLGRGARRRGLPRRAAPRCAPTSAAARRRSTTPSASPRPPAARSGSSART